MKKPVLERSMFSVAVGKAPKSASRGILTGLEDLDIEMEGKEEDDRDEYEDRTPDNLEIIANNLRGDIRSMDERYMELAQMVGEAAFDTPEEVVALMQTQLAQQQQPMSNAAPAPGGPQPAQQGLAALGAPSAPPPGGIMTGIAEPQPMPAPVGMAQGGLVYRQAGSPPMGERAAQVAEMQRRISDMMLTGPAKAMGDFYQQQSPLLTRASQKLFQPISQAAGRGVNLLNQARPYYNAMGPYGRGVALTTAGALPLLGYMAGQEPPPEGGPEFSEVPGVDEQGRYRPVLRSIENMPGTMEEKIAVRNMGFDNLTPRLGLADEAIEAATPGAMRPIEGPPSPPTPVREFPMVKAEVEEPKEKTPREAFRDRVKEKMEIYSEFLGSDPEMRKAQALFVLAEAALNVAGATGRSTAERLSKGLKGLPAGMSALGAEAEKERRAIAAASITSVEQEMADERRIAGTLQREMLRRGGSNLSPKVASLYTSLLARFPKEDPRRLLQEAIDIDNGTLTRSDKTGEILDTATGKITRTPYEPLNNNSVGYIDPNMPYTRVSDKALAPALPGEREALLKRRGVLQQGIEENNQMISMIYGDAIGVLPTIRSGVSNLFLSTFGDVGLGLTNAQLNVARNNLDLKREELLKLNARNAEKFSVYDQKAQERLIKDPNAFFASQELFLGNIAALQRDAANELAQIDSRLFGTPLVQREREPTGTKTDPIILGPNSNLYLDQLFTNRPNAAVWTVYERELPNGQKETKTVRITGQEYFQQRRAQ